MEISVTARFLDMFRTWNKELNRQFCHSNSLLQGSWCCYFYRSWSFVQRRRAPRPTLSAKPWDYLACSFTFLKTNVSHNAGMKKQIPAWYLHMSLLKPFPSLHTEKISVEIRSEQGLYNLLLYLKGLILSTIVFLFFSDSIRLVSVLYQSCISISGNVILPVPLSTCCTTFLQASPSLQLRVTFRSLFMITLVTKTPRKVV